MIWCPKWNWREKNVLNDISSHSDRCNGRKAMQGYAKNVQQPIVINVFLFTAFIPQFLRSSGTDWNEHFHTASSILLSRYTLSLFANNFAKHSSCTEQNVIWRVEIRFSFSSLHHSATFSNIVKKSWENEFSPYSTMILKMSFIVIIGFCCHFFFGSTYMYVHSNQFEGLYETMHRQLNKTSHLCVYLFFRLWMHLSKYLRVIMNRMCRKTMDKMLGNLLNCVCTRISFG